MDGHSAHNIGIFLESWYLYDVFPFPALVFHDFSYFFGGSILQRLASLLVRWGSLLWSTSCFEMILYLTASFLVRLEPAWLIASLYQTVTATEQMRPNGYHQWLCCSSEGIRLALEYATRYLPWLEPLLVAFEFVLERWGHLYWLYLLDFCLDSPSVWVVGIRLVERINYKEDWIAK